MTSLLARELVFVTGKGGVGKTTVAAGPRARGRAARGRRDDRRARSAARRACPRGARPRGRAARGRGRARRRAVGDHDRPRRGAARSGPGAARRPAASSARWRARTRSGTSSPRRPGAKELVTIAKVWELAQPRALGRAAAAPTTSWSSTRPASGHGARACSRTPRHVRRDRPRRADRRQARKVADLLRDPARTALVAVALAGEMPVSETLELERPRAGRARPRPRRTSSSTRSCPQRFGRAELAARRGPRRRRAAPVLARACASHHGLAAAQRRAAAPPAPGGGRRPSRRCPSSPGARLHPHDVEHLAAHLARRLDGAA